MPNFIRVGILGCAQIAKRSLAPAFMRHPSFELVAVASRTSEKAKDFVENLKNQHVRCHANCMTYDDLVDSQDVDFVYCPLPTGMHFEWVKRALESGKHVLCEKSLASTCEEVVKLVETAKLHRRLLMESFQFRFHAQNLYVRELLLRNTIGDIRQLVVRFGIPPFPDGVKNIRYHKELGGGALLDNGAYTVKCATYLLGPDVSVLAAMFGGCDSSLGNVDLTGSLMMSARYRSGTGSVSDVAVQAAYGFDHYYQNSYEIWGTQGKISTVRAFTAREDFAAPVSVETNAGRQVKTFNDNHFDRMLEYVYETLSVGDYEVEYRECLNQSSILASAAHLGGLK